MAPYKERMHRVYISAIILLAYLSLNVGFAADTVLCINTDGDALFKFGSCEICCSSYSDHSHESLDDRAGISNEFQTKKSCCPCSDIPISSYISQFQSRTSDREASCIFAAFASGLPISANIPVKAFGWSRMLIHMNQFFSLLKTSILLN
jgi:hypothetical protein